MKKIIFPGLVAGATLLILSYIILFLTIRFLPSLVEEYYNPIFWPGSSRAILFYAHPFVLCFALAWFWNRFKENFRGAWWLRGIELGFVYALIATLPSMWITFSAIDVSITMVMSWFFYGFFQASMAGMIFAGMNP